jgi:hypothetical protein
MHTATATKPAPRCAPGALRQSDSATKTNDAGLRLYDHGHIKTAFHARLFKTGELCAPGCAPEVVRIAFLNFQYNPVQERLDAVFRVLRPERPAAEYFASAFRWLWL